FFALRSVMCATHADFTLFAEAFAVVFAVAEDSRDPLQQLGRIERAVLPKMGIPMEADGPMEMIDVPVPAAYSEEELLREKDFAEYTDAERALARLLLARLARRSPQR